MLEPPRSIKPTQPFNFSKLQKAIESSTIPSVDGDGEVAFETLNQQSYFLSSLSRKKRSGDEMEVNREPYSRPYSNQLIWDNELQLIWYGDNKREELKQYQGAFIEKMQEFLQRSINRLSEVPKNWLSEKAYPTDYELGYFSWLACKDDAYALLESSQNNLEVELKQIVAKLKNLEEQAGSGFSAGQQSNYQDKRKKLLDEQSELLKKRCLVGWKLLGVALHPAINNGYVGVVYWHAEKKHIVIAHRGTKPKNLGADWTDLKGIILNKKVAQMDSATSFSYLVLASLPEEIKSISFTGHSLGGWLAQITTFSSEYLERSGNYFKKRAQLIYHPHTVVFDSPGCQPMLAKLKRSFDVRYVINKPQLDIHALDIQVYLSAPNMINTLNPHVGTIYRLFPKLQNNLDKEVAGETSKYSKFRQLVENYLTDESFMYTVRAHKLGGILNAWPKNEDRPTKQEVQLVHDWPIASKLMNNQEYNQFFTRATGFNNYHVTDESAVTQSGFRIRYRTSPVDLSSVSMNIFNPEERQFLYSIKILQDWFIEQKGHLEIEQHELTELNRFFQEKKLDVVTITSIMHTFQAYTLVDHGDRFQAREPQEHIAPLINRFKQLLRFYPGIHNVVKQEIEKRPTLIQAIYASESDRWINTLRDQIDLRWQINRERLGLVNFIKDKEARVLHIAIESEEMKLVLSQLGYDVLTAIGEKEDNFFSQLSDEEKTALAPYAHSDAVTFLSVEQVRLQQSRGFSLEKFYRSNKSPPLLWLEGELIDEDVWQTELFNGKLVKKIIVLTKVKSTFYQFLKHQPWGSGIYRAYYSNTLGWSDLTVESRQDVLERVTVQGKKDLTRLIGFNNWADISIETSNEKLTALNKVLDIKTLIKLINNRIDIGSVPKRLAHLEATYSISQETIIIDKLKAVLLKDFSEEQAVRYIIISGFFDPDISVVKAKLVQQLELAAEALETEVIKSQVDFYDIPEPGNKRIFIASNQFTGRDFKEFCVDYNPWALRVDWIHWENNQFILQYSYDPGFYINRKFYYKDKIIIDNSITHKEVSVQVGDDLFIFSHITLDKRSWFITRLKNILQPFKPEMSEYVLEKFKTNEAVKNIRVTLASENREALFKSFNQMGSVHWLKQYDEQKRLIWQCSAGSLEPLYSYIDEIRTNNAQELLSERDFIKKINNKAALIIDEPGMGKTTVLTELAASMLDSSWIIRINLRSYEDVIERLSSVGKYTLDEVIDFLSATDHSGLGSDLAKKLMRYKLQSPNEGLPLLLLFDGFDEIKDDKKESKNKISLLFDFLKDKATVWVTARKHEIKTLENSLLVFDTQLEELDVGAQREFLKKFWYSRLFLTLPQSEGVFERKCKVYIETLLREVNSALRLDNSRFMGIPLQLRLLGEGFQKRFTEFVNDESNYEPKLEDISILNLYEQFIHARYDRYLEKQSVLGDQTFIREATITAINKRFRRLAFYKLFGDGVEVWEIIGIKPPFVSGDQEGLNKVDSEALETLFRVGLIQAVGNNNFEFIHKSFAEYFVTELLISQLNKIAEHHNHSRVQKLLLTNVLIKPEHQIIRVFFDEQLAKGLVLLSENLAEYADVIDVFWALGEGDFFNEQGKTALHVAVEEQRQKTFDYLLDIFKSNSNARVNFLSARDLNGETALYLAIKQNKKKYVRKFLDNIKKEDDHAKHLLLLATMFRTDEDENDPVIKKLLDGYLEQDSEFKKIAKTIKDSWKLSALFLEAAEDGQLMISDYWNTNFNFLDYNTKSYLLVVTNKNRATALHLAIIGGHHHVIEMLIQEGASVHVKAGYKILLMRNNGLPHFQYNIIPLQPDIKPLQYEITPLQLAVSQKQNFIVSILLAAGAKINPGQSDINPLYMAATLNDEHMVDELLLFDDAVDVNIQVPTGETPLYWAAYHDNQKMVSCLLGYNADVNLQTNDGVTPLYWAVSQNNQFMAALFLHGGANVNVGHGDTTPLYAAVRNNDSGTVARLLKAGALPDIKGDKGDTLLLLAIRDNLGDKPRDKQQKDKDQASLRTIVKALLSHGADVNEGQNGETPLYWAIRNNDEEIASTLLNEGADVNMQLSNGETPLYWAVKKKSLRLVRELLSKKAEVNIQVEEKGGVIHTLLSLARENNSEAIETVLLENGAKDNVERGIDYKLYFAIQQGDKATLEALLKQGANVNTVYGGKTLLHWAIQYTRYDMVKTLLHEHAEVNTKTVSGDTSLYLAIKYGLDNPVETSEIIDLLLDRGIDINVNLRNGDPLLCWTIRKSVQFPGALTIVKLLLERGIDVNLQSDYGETPLYLATRYSFFDVVETLLDREVNVNVKLVNGETPLYWAVRHNSLDIVEKLLQYGADISVSEKMMDSTLSHKYESIVKKLSKVEITHNVVKNPKRSHEGSEDYFKELKKSRSFDLNLEDCLPGTSGYKPSGRSERNAVGEACQISWGDVDEFNEEKENPRDLSQIKINSDKFLDKLKNPTLSEIKCDQLLQLADKVSVIGESKEQVDSFIKDQKTLMYLQKVGYVSALTMHGMMAKNILSDFLQDNYEGVAINIGFIAGSQGFAQVAKASSAKGMQLVLNDKRLLGQSLKLASPFLARGTSVFITYDLVNQIKAYNEGDPDAVVGIIGDSTYLSVDGIEIGVELAEIGGLLEGVSSVVGPIGLAISAVTFIGTDVYLVVKQIHQMDALIHLTSTEKFIESLRTFIGMKPEQYIERLLKGKAVNNQLADSVVTFLNNNKSIKRYILPTVEERVVCHKPLSMGSFAAGNILHRSPHRRPPVGIVDLRSQSEQCNFYLNPSLDNTIVLSNKQKHIKWSRIKPDVREGNLFCAPEGNDIEIPREGAYLCSKAMGIEQLDLRTGNITFFDLGDGADTVIGFPQGDQVVKLGSGFKYIILGDGDDIFFLTGGLVIGSLLHGGDGINTLDLAPKANPISFVQMNDFQQIQNYLLRENVQDTFVARCGINYIDGRGGESEEKLDIIQVPSDDSCAYSLKILLRPYSDIRIDSENKESQFIYMVPIATHKGEAALYLGESYGSHRLVSAYGLSEISRLIKTANKQRNPIRYTMAFDFEKNAEASSDESKDKFKVTVAYTSENKLSYVLRDNVEIKIVQDNFYAFQTTNSSVDDIIKAYPRIAERLKISVFVQLKLTNESIAIGHGKHDVLSNDPYHRSHLVGNGGENIFVIHSGYEVLDESKLPLPEVILYDKDDQNLIDTLDLRKIKNQLQEDLEAEIRIRASSENKDILLELFTPQLKIENLVSVRLKDALETNWHQRLHIILNHAPMVLDSLSLKPLPLKFSPDKEIIIISPEDIEENTKVVISKKLGDYHYFRLGNNLIVSNILDSNITDSERYTLSLQDFYRTYPLSTLSIQFEDKEIVLKEEIAQIAKAKDFALEHKLYDRAMLNRLLNRNVTEQATHSVRRTPVRRSHHDIHEAVIEKKEVNKTIWGSVISCILPVIIAGVGAVFGYRYQMRARLRANAMPVVYPAAIAAPLLAPIVEANSFEKGYRGNKKSESAGKRFFIENMVGDLLTVNNVSLLKCSIYPFWPSAVERMNQVEDVLVNSANESMSLEQRVAKALETYDAMNGTNTLEDMISSQAKSSTMAKLNRVNDGNGMGRNSVTFFHSGSAQPSIANDSRINASSVQSQMIGRK